MYPPYLMLLDFLSFANLVGMKWCLSGAKFAIH